MTSVTGSDVTDRLLSEVRVKYLCTVPNKLFLTLSCYSVARTGHAGLWYVYHDVEGFISTGSVKVFSK